VVAVVTGLVMHARSPSFSVSGARSVTLRIHPRPRWRYALSALRARTAHRSAPVEKHLVSHSFVDTPGIAFSRSATLASFHTIQWTVQPVCLAAQNRALVGLGPQCSVVLGTPRWQCTRAMPPALREANCAQAYTWSASASTHCGREVQDGSAPVGCKPVVSQSGQAVPGREARVPQLGVALMCSWSNPEASKLWVVSPAAKLALARARSAWVVLCKQPSNPSLQGTVQQRRCRCRPAPELWR
jgi:hypothetical protein